MEIHLSSVALGVIQGLNIGLLAVGLVLIYRTTRVVNFAHGELGAVAAVLLSSLIVDHHWPYGVALAFVFVVAAVIAGACELLLRRLFGRPRVLVMVATIGISQFLFLLTLVPLVRPEKTFVPFPVPFTASFELDHYTFHEWDILTLVVAPFVVILLALFLTRTRHGLAMRAMAENGESARLAGVSVRRLSTIAWMIAGVLAAITVILASPAKGSTFTEVIPLDLLVRALAAALIGAMVSLPVAFGAGIAIGVVQSVVAYNWPTGSNIELAIFTVLLVAMFARARGLKVGSRDEERSSWRFAAVAESGRDDTLRRRVGLAGALGALAVAAAAPAFVTEGRAFLYGRVELFAVIALSLTILTGWAGQLSLGQFAFVAVGALVAAHQAGSVPLVLLVPLGGAVAAIVAVIVGLPALRIKGLYLAVSTLAFAVLMEVSVIPTTCWTMPLVHNTFCTGLPDPSSTLLKRPTFLGIDVSSDRAFSYICLGLLVLALLAARLWRDHGVARVLIAVRDNEVAAAAMGVRVLRVKALGFALSGFLAGSAGVCLAFLTERINTNTFTAPQSILVVSMAIIGGLGSVPGAVLGALYLIGLPAFFDSTPTIQFLTSSLGLTIALLYLPGGLSVPLRRIGDAITTLVRQALDRDEPSPASTELAEISS
jgi:ABC-type branched-subunit amino acid transport system permease subunit